VPQSGSLTGSRILDDKPFRTNYDNLAKIAETNPAITIAECPKVAQRQQVGFWIET